MKQADANQAVPHATSENISTIKRLDFLLAPVAETLRHKAMNWSLSDEPAVA